MNKLAQVMQALDITDQWLSDQSHVGRVTITRGRLGQRNFSLEDSLAISEVLRGHLEPWDLPMKDKSRRALERIRIRELAPRAESAA